VWLLNRLFEQGDQPTPRFAFQGTVNWMRALSIYTGGDQFSHESLRNFYLSVQRRPANKAGDTLALECLTMAMHNVSALDSMVRIENPYPIVRSAIVSWYYATYYSSKAMLAASSGSDPQTHASAGKIFQSEIVGRGLVKRPFDLSITNLIPLNINSEPDSLRSGNTHDLNTLPEDEEMAFGALCSYLKGTAEYEQWRLEEQVKSSSEYRRGGFNDFRTNAAKALRDVKLSPANVNYLVQAFRYRGKANYRDAIYLSYGSDQSDRLNQFVEDLCAVSGAYTLMAAHYLARRIVRSDWVSFIEDIGTYAQFDLPFDLDDI
jgi:hypothetical protein